MSDTRFDLDLRVVLRDMAPAEVPASLRDAVAAVPRSNPVPSNRPSSLARPRMAVFASLAAVIVLGVVGLVVLLGGFGGNVAAPSATPSATASPVSSWTTLTYERALPASTTPPTDSMRPSLLVAEARLRSARIPFTSQATFSEFSVTVPTNLEARAADLLGTTGDVAFVPMGSETVASGDTIDLTAHPPMFGSEGIASAGPGTDAAGQRTVDFTLAPSARTAFATYTSANIGEYFAIVLDGKVITAPVILGAIPNGQVQVTSGALGGFDTDAQANLIAMLTSKPYPAPVRQVGSVGATPPANLWTPAPTSSQQPETSPTPVPSATPEPTALPSFTVATNLTVEPLPRAPAGIRQIVHWPGGYAAAAVDTTSSQMGSTLWSSTDGLTWSPLRGGLTDGAGASPLQLMLAPCGAGLLVLGIDFAGAPDITASYTTDGSTWAASTIPGGIALSQVTSVVGGDAGAVATGGTSLAIETTDCVSWRSVAPPGNGPLRAAGVGTVGSRFVVTGFSGDPSTSAHVHAVSWWSDDLASWHAVRPKTAADQGFGAVVASNPSLLVAEMTYPGYTPGQRSWWATTDGTAWHQLSAPLGVYDDGAGPGSVAGWVTGIGGQVFDWGVPRSAHAGTAEFWVTVNGRTWTQLAVAGSGAAAILNGDAAYHPLQVPGAILFSTPTGPTMVGTGPAASAAQ
jgi:hypothetical protein